jgi:flagellar assembly factor FliW
MNLQAPIVVNLRTRTALQFTLPGGDYSSRHVIPRTTDESEAALTAKAS